MPDLGEGLEEGEIVAWLVAAGDDVTLNQPLVEVETAKATVEIPSPFAGRIATLHGAVGDAVPVGSPLVTFALADGDAPVAPPCHSRRRPRRRRRRRHARGPQAREGARDRPRDGHRHGPRRTDHGRGPQRGRADRRTTSPTSSPSRRCAGRSRKRLTEVAAIPQVTTFRTVDCTELEAFRRDAGRLAAPGLRRGAGADVRRPPVDQRVVAGRRHPYGSVGPRGDRDRHRARSDGAGPAERPRDGHRGDRRRDPAAGRGRAGRAPASRTTCAERRSA